MSRTDQLQPIDSAPPHPYLVCDVDAKLIEQPLAYVAATLFRIRLACHFLELLTDDSLTDPIPVARGALHFFARDWLRHVYVLQVGLFPLVMARTQIGDRVDQVMRRLLATRRDDLRDLELLKRDLGAIREGRQSTDDEAVSARLRAFARAQRRHVEWVEALVLPAARDCLNAADLAQLGRRIEDSENQIVSSSMLFAD